MHIWKQIYINKYIWTNIYILINEKNIYSIRNAYNNTNYIFIYISNKLNMHWSEMMLKCLVLSWKKERKERKKKLITQVCASKHKLNSFRVACTTIPGMSRWNLNRCFALEELLTAETGGCRSASITEYQLCVCVCVFGATAHQGVLWNVSRAS